MTDLPYCHEGACDCGAVTLRFYAGSALEALSPRACQCEYCLPRNLAYLSECAGRLEVRCRDLRILYAHKFGTRTADFVHCALCNSAVFVRSEIEGRDYALVVASALSNADALAEASTVEYDGEALDERLQRRARYWIPELQVTDDAG